MILTVDSERWDEFYEKLAGPGYCDFGKNDEGKTTWRCKGGNNKDYAISLLKTDFAEFDIEGTLAYFHSFGGHCDCEIIFNAPEP